MNKKYYLRLVKLLKKEKGAFLLESYIYALIDAVSPFIYIYFPSIIIHLIVLKVELGILVYITIGMVLINTILLILKQFFLYKTTENKDLCNFHEKRMISEKLIEIEYQTLFEGKYADLVIRLRQESSAYGSILKNVLSLQEEIFSCWASIIISSITILTGLIRLTQNQKDFEELLWILVLSVTTLCFFLGKTLISVRSIHNRKKEELREEYSKECIQYEQLKNQLSNYRNGKEIRVFHVQDYIQETSKQVLFGKGMNIQKKMVVSNAITDSVGELLSLLAMLFIYMILVIINQKKSIPASTIVLVVGAFMEFITHIQRLFVKLKDREDIDNRAYLLFDILDAPVKRKQHHYNPVINKSDLLVEFDQVSYQYPNGVEAIKNVSFCIKKGQRIAIVGENGSGKTTLIKLVMGLITPNKGTLLFYSQEGISDISAVFQDYYVYSLPLGENVAMKLDYDKAKVKELLNNLDFPQSVTLDTVLYREYDKDGIELSGGEGQKVAIARGIYQNKNVVVLDEPTASLDPYSERCVFEQLEKKMKDKTVLFVSHRMSACQLSDLILVMDSGTIVQQGTHEELLKDKCGKYSSLWNAQSKYYQ